MHCKLTLESFKNKEEKVLRVGQVAVSDGRPSRRTLLGDGESTPTPIAISLALLDYPYALHLYI